MKKIHTSFRLRKETIERLDYIVERRNEWLETIGASNIRVNRTQQIESLILYAYLKLKDENEFL